MENRIRIKLTEALNPLVLEIVDESHKHAGHFDTKGGTHFKVKIVSRAFEALPRVERHRLVHNILKEELSGPIHALSLQLFSPNEAG